MSAAENLDLSLDREEIAEIAKAVMWHRGRTEWKMHDGQKVIETAYQNVKAKLFVANCSRRFGKTYWVVKECDKVARSKNKARVKVATAFLTDLEEFIIPAFEQFYEDCPEELKPRWKESKKKYIFKNGSEIQLIGLDRKPNGGRGNYCDLYVFDEAAFIKNVSRIYSSVVVPMTMYREGAKIIMISTPPDTPDHDFKDFVVKAKAENAYVELDIFKNPMATPAMIEEYKKECLTETDWQREYLCQFVTDKTKAIVPEMNGYNYKWAGRDEFYQYYHKYNAMDLGVRDLNINLYAYYDFKRAKICIEDETWMNGPEMTTPELHKQIAAKELELWGVDGKPITPYKRVADNNNPLLLLDLGTIHGMFFNSTSKDELHAMVNEMRSWVKAGRVEISEKCKYLIGSLQYGLWNDKRTEFARSKILGHYDAVAALMYLIRNIDQVTNPIPVKITFDDHVDLVDEKSNSLKRLKGLK
jgi:hypothetical protein